MNATRSDTSTHTRLSGRWLTVARMGWVLITILCVAAFIFGMFDLHDYIGGSTDFSSAVVVIEIISTAGFYLTGMIIFWRKSDDWMTLLVSLMLVTMGATLSFPLTALGEIHPEWLPGVRFLQNLGAVSLFTTLLIFPDGRFVPRWTGLALAVVVVLTGIVLFGGFELSTVIQSILAFLSLGAVSQTYRFMRVSSPSQRQQTKWVMFGGGIYILETLIYFVINWLFPMESSSAILIVSIYKLFSLALPLSIAAAILRFRLWDIDYVINRSLIYVGLTAILGVIFAGGFFGLQAALESVLGSGQAVLAAGISCVVIVALFNPARRWLRRFVDRRLYGIEIDYEAGLQEHAAREQAVGRIADTQTSFGDYVNLELLGRGGMGEVYRAHDPENNRSVAIKVLPPDLVTDERFLKRFTREAQTIARLKHPNIITLHDYGAIDGTPYMVMNYVDGPDLSGYLKERGRLSPAEALPVLQGVAAALDYAHRQGVVHRDVKPGNVMLDPVTATDDGRTYRAVLMDFGIARIVAGATQLTQTSILGTLDYIAPEQIQASAEVDGRADVYSFGVMTYQMLTGEKPFKTNLPGAILIAHLQQPAPDPRQIVPELPEMVAYAIMRAMEKEPDARFNTAGEFVTAMN